jgi:hypothetical protein
MRRWNFNRRSAACTNDNESGVSPKSTKATVMFWSAARLGKDRGDNGNRHEKITMQE